MQFTLDEELKAGTERLQELLSHRIPDGDVTAMYAFMLEAATEKVGKQLGAIAPERPRTPQPPVERPRGERCPIPAAVKREVWERDGGQCTHVGPDGRRCESRWQLEFHHPGLAWKTGSTAKDVTLHCKPHNNLEAEDVYGKDVIEARIGEKRRGGGEG
jgi:hypothetical protein